MFPWTDLRDVCEKVGTTPCRDSVLSPQTSRDVTPPVRGTLGLSVLRKNSSYAKTETDYSRDSDGESSEPRGSVQFYDPLVGTTGPGHLDL